MRILKIEMENLNSLKGYWSIDLTHPDYEKFHNLFVISGDTGSGKTTILDAITLALYAKTSRQGTITIKENEVMTKHTGYCRARVTYVCKAGKFVSEFFQKRADKRPYGNLQTPECKISNVDDGTTESYAPTLLEAQTQKIIQLNYEQFSRSMLLAQGQFDKFISGDERSRAAILAKLNGTEKYREIGKRICDKARIKNTDFKAIKDKLDDIKLLSDEEQKSLEDEQKQKAEENLHIDDRMKIIDEGLNWYKANKEFKEALNSAEENRTDFEKRKNDSAGSTEKLKKAENAKNCDADYAKLKQIENNLAEKLSGSVSLDEELKACVAALEKAAAETSEAEKACSEAELKLESDRKVWNLVRSLDASLKPQEENLESLKKTMDEAREKQDEARSNSDDYTKRLKKLDDDIKDLESYLKEHSRDGELEKKIVILEHQGDDVASKINEIHSKTETIDDNEKSLADKRDSYNSIKSEFEKLNGQLKDLVSAEYITVSLLLRNQLSEGKACPVCGSFDHPSCSDGKGAAAFDEKTRQVGVDVSSLNKRIEEANGKLQTLATEIEVLDGNTTQLESERKQLSEKFSKEIDEINGLISDWGYTLKADESCSSDIHSITAALKELGSVFKDKIDLKSQKEIHRTTLKTKLDAINIKELEEAFNNAETAYKVKLGECEKLRIQRKELFGDKDPDDEEKKESENLQTLRQEVESKKDAEHTLVSNKSAFSAQIETNKVEIAELQTQKTDALSVFSANLIQNEFKSEEEYLACKLSDIVIDQLKKEVQELIRLDGETQNALDTARRKLKENEAGKVAESEAALCEKKEFSEKTKAENNMRIGEINSLLKQNEEQQEKQQEIKKQYDEAYAQKLIWDEMRRFIGKKDDGEDFEVFVEALAFKQLLTIANKYVEAITKTYTLVQIPNKVDFLVHDNHNSDNKDDRPVSNMSGGEKFVISLSLALGIAELASRNIRVDSLFLDEGFGTLSGQPLREAIDALKSLQATGKMLGIITHIDAVINEFDLRIKAEKDLEGNSFITGPGITRQNKTVSA